MNQADLDFSLSPSLTRIAVASALDALHRDPLGFCQVTEGWFLKNKQVWIEFYGAAELLRVMGRSHYGAKAVMEHLRFESAIHDSETQFKLNNNYASGLGRLYNVVSDTEFFKTRRVG